MKFSRRPAIAAVAMLAAGCSLQPTYQQPVAPVTTAFPTGEAYKTPASSPASTTLPAADIGWKNFLADRRLQQLVELALNNNRDLRVAVLKVAQVQAQYRIQRAALFPQVNADASVSNSRTP